MELEEATPEAAALEDEVAVEMELELELLAEDRVYVLYPTNG